MMNNPLISFIIPAYNEEKLIGGCIDSIYSWMIHNGGAAENFGDEIIVVNNNSTDHTVEIIQKYFPKVKIVNEPKQSLVAARRSGFLESTGKYIMQMDADCVLPKNWNPFHLFQNKKNVVAVTGPYDYYDISFLIRLLVKLYYKGAYISYILNKHVFKTGAMLTGGNALILRSALEKCDAYNDNFEFYGEDTELSRQLSTVGNVIFSMNCIMPSSGRRLNDEGLFATFYHYFMNYTWSMLFKRPYTKKWANFR